MSGNDHVPEERQSPPPTPQPDVDEDVPSAIAPEQVDESAQRRASARKAYPLADEDEIRRSAEEGGEPPDVPPTDVAPPPGD